jgi:hypothetical protein
MPWLRKGVDLSMLKLKSYPFCGRKMVFTYINKYGKHVTKQYYMHVDYAINKDESCILDKSNMSFVIGAGDAHPDTRYIRNTVENGTGGKQND